MNLPDCASLSTIVANTLTEEVSERLITSPHNPLQKTAHKSEQTCRAAKTLQTLPYKVHATQQLHRRNVQNMCGSGFAEVYDYPGMLDATFAQMRRRSILQVCEISEYSHIVNGNSLSPCRGLSVVCSLSRGRVVSPIFLQNMINWELHIYLVHEFLGNLSEADVAEGWLQQNCATCHAVGTSVCEQSLFFTDGIWTSLLPDLSSPIFPPSRVALETVPTAITHEFGMNRRPTYP